MYKFIVNSNHTKVNSLFIYITRTGSSEKRGFNRSSQSACKEMSRGFTEAAGGSAEVSNHSALLVK